MSNKFECVRVVIRCRPLNDKEKKNGCVCIVNMDTKNGQVTVRNPKIVDEIPKQFTFDQIFDTQSLQENVYNSTAFPIVESVLKGYNGTIFAYGQTGTGKIHTMEGKDAQSTLKGIIPRTFDHIFERIKIWERIYNFQQKFHFWKYTMNQFVIYYQIIYKKN